MYSFRKDFGDRREEAVKKIPGYKELIAFFERSTNLSQHAQTTPSEFIGRFDVTLTINKKVNERLKAKWNGSYENGETITRREDFSNDCEFSDFTKIIIYILRKDNLDFKVLKRSENSKESMFIVQFKV